MVENECFLCYNINYNLTRRDKYMKKYVSILVTMIMFLGCISIFAACSNTQNSEVSIKYIDSKLYARFDSGIPGSGMGAGSSYMPADSAISFEEYEKDSAVCISRSNYYVRCMITFNNTPKDYKAIDVFELNYFTLDTSFKPERYMVRREGEKDNEIEALIYLQNYTFTETEHIIKSLTYTMFDSTVGKKVQKTFELNYKFKTTPIPNFINRFNSETQFDIIKQDTENINKILNFSVDTNVEYDSILCNLNRQGVIFHQNEYTSLENEKEFAKSNLYTYETTQREYYYKTELVDVGYVSNGVKYYFNPVSFMLWDYKV